MTGHVYILASKRHGTLYIGVTSDIARRIVEHRDGLIPGFTEHYGVKRLVYLETFDDITAAITREKQMKEWKRDWKIALIERDNPFWDDLAHPLFGLRPMPPQTPRHPGESRDPFPR